MRRPRCYLGGQCVSWEVITASVSVNKRLATLPSLTTLPHEQEARLLPFQGHLPKLNAAVLHLCMSEQQTWHKFANPENKN